MVISTPRTVVTKAKRKRPTGHKKRFTQRSDKGSVSAYVYLLQPDKFYRVPNDYWRGDSWWSAQLSGFLFGFSGDGIPSEFMDQPVVFIEAEVEAYLKAGGRVTHRGPPTIYDRGAFRVEAIAKLDEEGDYSDGWCAARLIEHMEGWCQTTWSKTPGETWLKEQVAAAREQFIKQRLSGSPIS